MITELSDDTPRGSHQMDEFFTFRCCSVLPRETSDAAVSRRSLSISFRLLQTTKEHLESGSLIRKQGTHGCVKVRQCGEDRRNHRFGLVYAVFPNFGGHGRSAKKAANRSAAMVGGPPATEATESGRLYCRNALARRKGFALVSESCSNRELGNVIWADLGFTTKVCGRSDHTGSISHVFICVSTLCASRCPAGVAKAT